MNRSAPPRIVIHAGMAKAGSTSIQHWLRRNVGLLAEHGYTLVVIRATDGPEVLRVAPHTGGPASSGPAVNLLYRPETQAVANQVLVRSLRRLAETHGRVVLTGEAFAPLFTTPDTPALSRIDELGESCEVRIAYYVRPQHTALEAAWRQWGFRTGLPPSRYIEGHAGQLHHLGTLRRVTRSAPNLDFRVRPLRPDVLVDGDVVGDFLEEVLEIGRSQLQGATEDNRGIPLSVANLLATVPQGLLWDSEHDNDRFNALKKQVLGQKREGQPVRGLIEAIARGDERGEQGREVLQRWARGQFAHENDALFELAGWAPLDWIPDVGDGDDELEAVDELWSSTASGPELALLHLVLEYATRPPTGTHRPLARA